VEPVAIAVEPFHDQLDVASCPGGHLVTDQLRILEEIRIVDRGTQLP